METVTYRVQGMTCGGCVASLTRSLEGALPGLKIAVTLDGGLVQIAGSHDVERVKQAVADAGFVFVGPA